MVHLPSATFKVEIPPLDRRFEVRAEFLFQLRRWFLDNNYVSPPYNSKQISAFHLRRRAEVDWKLRVPPFQH